MRAQACEYLLTMAQAIVVRRCASRWLVVSANVLACAYLMTTADAVVNRPVRDELVASSGTDETI